jgi:hypothetical protein
MIERLKTLLMFLTVGCLIFVLVTHPDLTVNLAKMTADAFGRILSLLNQAPDHVKAPA